MKTIGISGGTGFVGTQLTALLTASGCQVVIFTTRVSKMPAKPGVTYAHWNADKGECDINSLKRIDAMVHLAGAGIADKRWTDARKQEIVDSRVKGTAFLIAQLKAYAPRCKTLIAASATGFYGHDQPGQPPFTELAQPAPDFLGDTCKKWEAESHKGEALMRTVIFRFGIVLGRESGAFPEFEGPMAFGIMPILGNGRQVVSWIEITDLVRLLAFALDNESMNGIYNAVAPAPVTNRQLMQAIARAKGGIKIPVPAPAFALKIALGEMSEEILKSCTVSAEKTVNAGFSFAHPGIDSAVAAILGK